MQLDKRIFLQGTIRRERSHWNLRGRVWCFGKERGSDSGQMGPTMEVSEKLRERGGAQNPQVPKSKTTKRLGRGLKFWKIQGG